MTSTERIGRDCANQEGFSLVELLIVIAVIAIVLAYSLDTTNYLRRDKLVAATRQLYSDLQKVKQDALTQSSGQNSRGFGIRFTTNNAYTTFEFNDANVNYNYDNTSEETGGKPNNLASLVTVTLVNGSNPAPGVNPSGTGNVLIFDKRALARTTDWSSISGWIYVLTLQGEAQARCVQVDTATIREGKWNGTVCN